MKKILNHQITDEFQYTDYSSLVAGPLVPTKIPSIKLHIFQLFHVQVQNFEFKPNFSFIFKIICAAIISVYKDTRAVL